MAPNVNMQQVAAAMQAGKNTPAMQAQRAWLMAQHSVAYQTLLGSQDFGTIRHAQGQLIVIEQLLKATS